VVEYKDGQLSLITSSPRGGPGSVLGAEAHRQELPGAALRARSEDHGRRGAGLRAFGSENDQAAVQALVDDRMAELRPMHETTLEYLRMGAIQGIILDGDGATTLFNLFTEFGITQQDEEHRAGGRDTDVRGKCVAIARLSESELGGDMVTGYRAFCGDAFFDALVAHATGHGVAAVSGEQAAAHRPARRLRVRRHHLGELPRQRRRRELHRHQRRRTSCRKARRSSGPTSRRRTSWRP
jgi:hypothetical protein